MWSCVFVAAAMTFSMMFGNHQNGTDEYSTDEDADGNYYDDDEDEEDDEDYMGEEDLEEECQLEASQATMWEPQAKVYSNMNLKDDVNTMPHEAEAMLKKLKQAKKRAEKRKKQKERRNKEKESGEPGRACNNNEFGDVDIDSASPEVLEKLITFHQNKARDQMLQSIDDGCNESFEPLIVCRFGESLPAKIMDDVVSGFKLMLPSLNLFHRCITDFSEYRHLMETPNLLPKHLVQLAHNRVAMAERLYQCEDLHVDFAAVDEHGLSVLHRSITDYDVEYAKFVVDTIVSGSTAQRKISLNLNSRCHKKGWAPIHYAVDRANIPSIRLLAYAGANLQASSATDKRMVPLELAKARIKSSPSNSPSKDQAERVLSLLTEMISWQKTTAKDAEKSKKSDTTADVPSKTPTKSQGKVATPEKKDEHKSSGSMAAADPVVASKGSEKKKKKGQESKKKESVASSVIDSKVEPVSSTTPPPVVEDHSSSPSPTTGVTLHSGAIISFASHDEMMDNLLAMGFQESDCLQAIQRYGTDLDSAISWLCERPQEPIVEPTKKKEDPPVASAPVSRGTSGHGAKESTASSSGRGGSNRHSKSQESKNHDTKNQESKNRESKNRDSHESHESKQHNESKSQDSKAHHDSKTSDNTAAQAHATATKSKGWNVKEDSKSAKPFSFSQDIGIPTLPPPVPPTKSSQQKAAAAAASAVPPTPETSKRGSSRRGKSQAQSPAVNKRGAAASETSSTGHPATMRSTPPPVDAESAAASQAPPLSPPSAATTTTSTASFLPSFAAGGLNGGLGLGFGSIAQSSSGFMSSGFENGILGGSMGSFNASFVNALNSIGSASSDHDADFSLTAGGAIELSAGAKPFVPKTFTPAANPTPIGSGATGIQGASPLPEFSFGATEPSSSLGSSSFGASLPSIDESLRLLSQSSAAGSSLWSSSTVGLGIAGAGGLGSGLRPLGKCFRLIVCCCWFRTFSTVVMAMCT